jgi:predicted phage terminase large subunit-like protein
VIWVQTLWHPDDPAMRIIHSQADPTAPRWTIVRLPALAGTDDPLGRAPGEALCPQRYTADELEARRQSPALGRRGWLALYQQSPVPDEGAIWRSSYWRTHRLSPGGHWLWPDGDESQAFEVAELERYATVDLALGKSHGDQTVIAVWGYSAALGRVFLLDLQAGQYDWPETRRRIRRILEAQEDRPWQRALRVYIEDVQYQEAAVQDLQSDALGVSGITPAGRTKDARLKAVEPWGEQRRISHDADAHWRDALERQLLEFTGHVGDVDDIVDAWSYGVRVAMDGMATSGAPALARPLRPRWQIPR